MTEENKPGKTMPDNQVAEWFHERYTAAANEVIEFFGADFHALSGQEVADIGCGDGVMDLGIFKRVLPARMVGFDTKPTNTQFLERLAQEQGAATRLPPSLQFAQCKPESLPADNESFDYVFSWSTLHHVADPRALISEVRRILRPGGAFFIQLYPFYHSRNGSLLEQWFPEGFAQLTMPYEQIAARVSEQPRDDPAWAEKLLRDFVKLNRLTLDDLGKLLSVCGFTVTRMKLITSETRLPLGASSALPLSQLGIEGVKLLAVPTPSG